MGAQLLEQMFSPFFTTKGKGSGTGLGLAVVQGIVLSHGGGLVVESRIDAGTNFSLLLPRSRQPALVSQENAAIFRAPPPHVGRVLLVDDDPDFGDMVLTGLERRGYEVSPTRDPLEALAELRAVPEAWDVLVADQTMPNMMGLDLIKAAKAIRPELPCILCTGYTEHQLDDTLLRQAGVFLLLRKPLSLDVLVESLQQALGTGLH
jgi:CheY-like chemotaxis protein